MAEGQKGRKYGDVKRLTREGWLSHSEQEPRHKVGKTLVRLFSLWLRGYADDVSYPVLFFHTSTYLFLRPAAVYSILGSGPLACWIMAYHGGSTPSGCLCSSSTGEAYTKHLVCT